MVVVLCAFFFFKQKTAYEMRISDWSSDVCSSDLLLLALTLASTTAAGKALAAAGVKAEGLNAAINALRGGRTADTAGAEDRYDALKKFARDLTEAARAGKLDPVIGRDEEIRRTIQILARRTKNNPVLIGDPGVGKTAIAEGLALRIANGDVPDTLKDRTLMALDMGSLIARSEEHTSELQSLMRISYAGFCLKKKNIKE